MSKIPLKARKFLWIIYCLGGLSGVAAFTLLPLVEKIAAEPREIWLLPLFVIGAVAAGQRKIRLFGKDEDAGTMSLSFAVVYAALLHFGPQRALLASVASTLATCWLQPRDKRQPFFQASFNISVSIIEIVAAGTAFLLINRGTVALEWTHSPTALCAAALVFFFCNTLSVATIIGLCTEENPLRIWRESFMWMAPSFFFGAAAATAVTLMSQVVVHNLATSVITLVTMGLVLYLLHATYKMNVARTDALIASKEQLANLYLSTIRSLALAIDAKDQYTHKHILRVQQYAVATAKAMNVEGDELKAIETGALLHDIGKLGVPEYVLRKPGRLTDEELAMIKQHPQMGADILGPVEFPWPVLPVVKYHHERIDGSGYPEGLKGSDIPRTARILAVADVYDALTTTRSYRNAWTHERALAEIQRCAGTGFDPIVVGAFTQVIDNVLESMAVQRLDVTFGPLTTAEGTTAEPSPARVVWETQAMSADLCELREVVGTLSGTLGLQEVAYIIATRVQTIFAGTGCVILSTPIDNGVSPARALVANAAVGLGERFFAGCRTVNEQSLSLRTVSSAVPYRGAYDHDDLMPNSIADGGWCDLKSALIVPIRHRGEVLGTINLYHPESEAFTEDTVGVLEMIADSAASAIFDGILADRVTNIPATDLAGLRHLAATVEQRIDRATGEQVGLIYLDIDQFKPINEYFGHRKGDDVLGALAAILFAGVGADDMVARSGGDSFSILLGRASERETEMTALRLQAAVATFDPGLHHPRLGDLRIGVSIGSACFPRDGGDGNTLFGVADKRMRANKSERKLCQIAARDTESDPYLPARLAVAASGLVRYH